MAARVRFKQPKLGWLEAFDRMSLPMAKASTAAVREATEFVKVGGRQNIAAAGFSKRWQNTLRSQNFPKRGISLRPAGYIFHRIPYAGVFEDGAIIRGKPLLWVPLKNTPKKLGRRRMTPSNLTQETGQRLHTIVSPGGKPLLGARVGLSRTNARRARPKITQAALRRGPGGTGIVRTVPLFVGIDVANIRKRFNISGITRSAVRRLPSLYNRHLRVR